MTILWEDDLDGTPTSGTPNTTNHPWASAFALAFSYTASTVAGLRAFAAGPTAGAASVAVSGVSPFRLRWYGQWSGTPSNHHFMTWLKDGSNVVWADAQIRNTTGPPVWNRWNFSSAGATSAWTASTPWRFEYRYEAGGVGTLLEVWTDPADTGEPDWAITAAGTPSSPITMFEFGNPNGTSGRTLLMGALAMSDGPRIGPYVPPSSGGVSVRGVMVGGELVPASMRGVIQSGSLVPASLRGITQSGLLVPGS